MVMRTQRVFNHNRGVLERAQEEVQVEIHSEETVMAAGNVLIAVDDEAFGLAMVDFIGKHRWSEGTVFTVMHAIDPAEAAARWPSEQVEAEANNLVKQIADRLRSALADVQVEEVVSFGRAKECILDLAARTKAGLIVMGSHGRHGISRFVMGSVSQAVAAHAPCSVAIVKVGPPRAPGTDLNIDWRGTAAAQFHSISQAPMKVLLAVEDDKFGQIIVDFISDHGFPDGTTFRVLHVQAWIPSERELLACPSLMDYVEHQYEHARELVSSTTGRIKRALPRTSVEEEITEGQPAVRIIATAAAWGASAIIMGSHGRNDLQQFFLGSVSSAVLSHAHCSVIILRPVKDEPAPKHTKSAAKEVGNSTPARH